MTDVRFGPGGWWAVAGGESLLLLPPSLSAAVVERAHEALRGGSTTDLVAIAGTDLLRLPPFALVLVVDGRRRLLARDVTATIGGARVDGRGLLTWAEQTVPEGAEVRIEVEPDTSIDEVLRLQDGIVRCGAVLIGRSSVADVVEEPPTEATTLAATAAIPAVAGSLVLPDGSVQPLDRPVIVGRRPSAPRVGPRPHLVTISTATQDISRSHVEVRPEGATAVVTDLETSNGTLLLREGRPPLRLTGNDGQVLLDQDVIDLGDGVHLRYQAANP